MNENELTALLVQSCESNQSKYVPWWNTDMKHSMYRYHVFSEEEINNITKSVNQYSCRKFGVYSVSSSNLAWLL